MTPEQLAAKLLADVPRYTFLSDYGHLEQFIEETDALAAIARYLAPGDDLVAPATAALASYDAVDDWGDTQHRNGAFTAVARPWMREAAARISALSATVEELRYADRVHASANAGMKQRLETENATLRDDLAKLADPAAVHMNMLRGTVAKPTVEQIVHLYGADALRAALTDGGSNG